MQAFCVVVDPPVFDGSACLADAGEPVLVQALIPETAIEALDVGVLCGFTGIDEIQLNAVVISPGIKGATSQFGPITPSECR